MDQIKDVILDVFLILQIVLAQILLFSREARRAIPALRAHWEELKGEGKGRQDDNVDPLPDDQVGRSED
ncbi:hypothetical protein [Streptomyces milbemycinicus]|uniref:Uncharacterized protein n=1 Tax=Streptomyces milbemycinicus TaxID=476552 RepID=A0ABW8LMG4_9ACTN